MIQLTGDEVARFWSKVQRDPECWPWTGETNNRGYGRFTIYRDGRRIRLLAHRVAYTLAAGQDPQGELVRHGCDNPTVPQPCRPDRWDAGRQHA